MFRRHPLAPTVMVRRGGWRTSEECPTEKEGFGFGRDSKSKSFVLSVGDSLFGFCKYILDLIRMLVTRMRDPRKIWLK